MTWERGRKPDQIQTSQFSPRSGCTGGLGMMGFVAQPLKGRRLRKSIRETKHISSGGILKTRVPVFCPLPDSLGCAVGCQVACASCEHLCLPLCPAVVYVCCAPDTFREFMLHAHHEGLTTGDYAFFYIDLFGTSMRGSRFPSRKLPWQHGDGNDDAAREAYKVGARHKPSGARPRWKVCPHVEPNRPDRPPLPLELRCKR